MKLYKVNFKAMWPVPSGLIILAKSKSEAKKIAKETITHTDKIAEPELIKMDKSKVVFYESGDY